MLLPDHIQITKQSSIRIRGSRTVYFDPYSIPNALHDADLVFLTHPHSDHFSPEDLTRVVKNDTLLVMPQSMEKEVSRSPFGYLRRMPVAPGETRSIDGIEFTAVPAYNHLKPFHPKRKHWVGYRLVMDGTAIYAAGDTDLLPELEQIRADIVLVPVGGMYTMGHKDAAALVNRIRPAYAIPIHYGSIVGTMEDAARFQDEVDSDIRVLIRIRD